MLCRVRVFTKCKFQNKQIGKKLQQLHTCLFLLNRTFSFHLKVRYKERERGALGSRLLKIPEETLDLQVRFAKMSLTLHILKGGD